MVKYDLKDGRDAVADADADADAYSTAPPVGD
jgi:hypothetical protein